MKLVLASIQAVFGFMVWLDAGGSRDRLVVVGRVDATARSSERADDRITMCSRRLSQERDFIR